MRGSRYVARVRGLGEPLWTLRVRGPLNRLRAISAGWWVAGLTIAFIAITVWWLMANSQVPDYDSAPHLQYAFVVRSEILAGQWSAIFTDFNSYPPLGHIVGAIGTLVGGLSVTWAIFAGNLVFVPLLVGGCYGAGKIAYGPRAGLLAALFALGAPMISSEFHEFYLDPFEASMVAVSVWALLASRRFERVGYSALAGLLCALGMLTKQTFVLFVGGLIVVMFLRGGWRNWKGLIAFLAVGLALGLPWYVDHISQLSSLTSGFTTPGASGTAAPANSIAPARFSAANVAWYLWDLLNRVLLTPLTLLFLTGAVLALWRFCRRRATEDLTPELLGGGLVGYLGISYYITLRDPRYALPALVYAAVLGTGWIATARPPLRRWLTAAFCAVVAINFVAINFGGIGTLALKLPGASPSPTLSGARTLTFLSPMGWRAGPPVRDGDLLGLFRGLKKMGVNLLEFDGGSVDRVDLNNLGLVVLAEIAGIAVPAEDNLPAMGPQAAFVRAAGPVPGDPPPCQTLVDGTGVYVSLGNPLAFPLAETTFVCPERRHAFYHAAQAPGAPAMPAPLRTYLSSMLGAMRRQGVTTVEFDASTLTLTPYFDRDELETLAASTGLRVPGAYNPGGLGPHQAFLMREPWVLDKVGPDPCARMPDGSGLYIVLGNPLRATPQKLTYYCPLLTPRFSKW